MTSWVRHRGISVEIALKLYYEYMGSVDCVNQCREVGRGFAAKLHYKKWYKQTFFALLNFMLLNGWFRWNMGVEELPEECCKVKKYKFYATVVEEMLMYVVNKNNLQDLLSLSANTGQPRLQNSALSGVRGNVLLPNSSLRDLQGTVKIYYLSQR